MKYVSLFAAFLLISSSVICAQNLTLPQNEPSSLFSFPSTLPLNNLKLSQSISFSTTYNSGTKSAYYLSNFCNSFSLPPFPDKLKLALDLNFVNLRKNSARAVPWSQIKIQRSYLTSVLIMLPLKP